MTDARRAIPSVDRLLASSPLQAILASSSRTQVVAALRAVQQQVREQGSQDQSPEWYAEQAELHLRRANQPSLRPVINATGVVLHTNLGRAPLSQAALQAIRQTAKSYSNLEFDFDRGERGSRYSHCEARLKQLSGAEAALVVNNNAAALVLVLNTLAMRQPAVISRGELVEIGDSFRIAEIAERSGAMLREVGATNRTHLRDYEVAIDGAAAILKVHPSNFKTSGFVSDVPVSELAALARRSNVPLIHDAGSGLIDSLEDIGLSGEPTAAKALEAGADIVTMSGDKLLGGPQAGIILGRADLVAAMKRNPLCRALRVDKLTLAALEATLLSYEQGTARTQIPVLRMLSATPAEVHARAQTFAEKIPGARLREGASAVGGGAFPDAKLPTTLIEIEAEDAIALQSHLRDGDPPVIARIANDRVVLDLRTVLPDEEPQLLLRLLDV